MNDTATHTRRAWLRMLAGSAGASTFGAAVLPALGTETGSALPSCQAHLAHDIRKGLDALGIAQDALERMEDASRRDRSGDLCFSPAQVREMYHVVGVQIRLLEPFCPHAETDKSPDVEKVRVYRHRYRRNLYGSERASLAMCLATKAIDNACDNHAGDEEDELYCALLACGWVCYSLESLIDSTIAGDLKSERPQHEPPLGVDLLAR